MGFGTVMAPNLREVIDGSGDSCHAFVVLRACLPAVRQFLAADPQLVGTQPQKLLALAVKNSLVRPKELVTRASEEVGIDRLHIDEAVRRVLHRVHERHGSCGMRQSDGLMDIIDRADGHQPRIASNLGLQIEHVQSAVARPDVRGPDLGAAFFKAHPGRHIRVVIEARDQQFVAVFEFAADGAAQRERQ